MNPQRYIVVRQETPTPYKRQGDILTLHYDDGTNCPYFINTRTGETICCNWERLEPYGNNIMEGEE